MFAVVLVDDVRYQEREGRVSRERRAPGEFLRQNSACDFLRVRFLRLCQAFPRFLDLGLGFDPRTSEHEVNASAWPSLRLPLWLTALLAFVLLPQAAAAAAAAHVAAVIDRALSLPASKDAQTSPCFPACCIFEQNIYDRQSISLSLSLVWLLGRSWPCKPQPSCVQAFRRSG
jgi:hypothetical protein